MATISTIDMGGPLWHITSFKATIDHLCLSIGLWVVSTSVMQHSALMPKKFSLEGIEEDPVTIW